MVSSFVPIHFHQCRVHIFNIVLHVALSLVCPSIHCHSVFRWIMRILCDFISCQHPTFIHFKSIWLNDIRQNRTYNKSTLDKGAFVNSLLLIRLTFTFFPLVQMKSSAKQSTEKNFSLKSLSKLASEKYTLNGMRLSWIWNVKCKNDTLKDEKKPTLTIRC